MVLTLSCSSEHAEANTEMSALHKVKNLLSKYLAKEEQDLDCLLTKASSLSRRIVDQCQDGVSGHAIASIRGIANILATTQDAIVTKSQLLKQARIDFALLEAAMQASSTIEINMPMEQIMALPEGQRAMAKGELAWMTDDEYTRMTPYHVEDVHLTIPYKWFSEFE